MKKDFLLYETHSCNEGNPNVRMSVIKGEISEDTDKIVFDKFLPTQGKTFDSGIIGMLFGHSNSDFYDIYVILDERDDDRAIKLFASHLSMEAERLSKRAGELSDNVAAIITSTVAEE